MQINQSRMQAILSVHKNSVASTNNKVNTLHTQEAITLTQQLLKRALFRNRQLYEFATHTTSSAEQVGSESIDRTAAI